MDYEQFYDFIMLEIERLQTLDVIGDYRLCKALAACYDLQEYLANRIAELRIGSDFFPEDEYEPI